MGNFLIISGIILVLIIIVLRASRNKKIMNQNIESAFECESQKRQITELN
ncbi:MAG: hypothetical protein WCJ57_03130 [Candidatus Falkowbacteria bacterium]